MYDEWGTPKEIIDKARQVMGSINIDAASNSICQEYIQADKYFGLDNGLNSLEQNWSGTIWLNPPYSAGNIDRFVDKAINEWIGEYFDRFANKRQGSNVNQMILLVNSSTDCSWYHKLLSECNSVLLYKGRIKFWKIFDGKAHERWEGEKSKKEGKGKIGNSPRYLSTLFYYGNNADTFREVFKEKGTFLEVRK